MSYYQAQDMFSNMRIVVKSESFQLQCNSSFSELLAYYVGYFFVVVKKV